MKHRRCPRPPAGACQVGPQHRSALHAACRGMALRSARADATRCRSDPQALPNFGAQADLDGAAEAKQMALACRSRQRQHNQPDAQKNMLKPHLQEAMGHPARCQGETGSLPPARCPHQAEAPIPRIMS